MSISPGYFRPIPSLLAQIAAHHAGHQQVSMFSTPSGSGRIFAIVPMPFHEAYERLKKDDPCWSREGVRFEDSWTIDTQRYHARLRDKLVAWYA